MKKILQILVPLLIAILLFWLVYKDMDFSKLVDVFKSGLHWEWIILAVLISALSNVLRGLRWQQLLEPVCPGSRKKTAILAVFISYAVNLLFPRAGEVARCGILSKHDTVSFTRSFGTVITERAFDTICLLLIALLAIVLQLGFFNDFFSRNPDSLAKLTSMATSPFLWGGLAGLVLLFLFLKKLLKQSAFYEKGRSYLLKLWEGMKSVKTLKNPLLFLFYTVLIWVMYFSMFYVGRFFFPFEVPLGFLAMLSAFVMGSLGVLAPVQGGIGSYHFMVIYTVTFFGIAQPEAGIFALVIHGIQTVQSLLFGLIAWIWILARDRESKKQENRVN